MGKMVRTSEWRKQWAPGSENLRMVDAKGNQIAHDGVTKARNRTVGKNGKSLFWGNVHPMHKRVERWQRFRRFELEA